MTSFFNRKLNNNTTNIKHDFVLINVVFFSFLERAIWKSRKNFRKREKRNKINSWNVKQQIFDIDGLFSMNDSLLTKLWNDNNL